MLSVPSGYVRSYISSQNFSQTQLPDGNQREKQDQCQINREKFDEEAADARMLRMRIELQTDETGQARDRGAEAAHVDAQKKRMGLRGEAREQKRGRHIADDLACEQGSEILPSLHQPADCGRDRLNPGEVSGEDEERDEGQKQHEVRFQEQPAVKDQQNRDEFKAYVEANGGKVAGSVSKKTGYLVNNDVTSTSSKNTKARELGIPILSEEDFIAQFGPEEKLN